MGNNAGNCTRLRQLGKRAQRGKSIFVAARIALGGDAIPDLVFFVLRQENPVGHFHGGAPAAPADIVIQRGANRHARRIPTRDAMVFVGSRQGGVQGAHGRNNSIVRPPGRPLTLLPAGLWRIVRIGSLSRLCTLRTLTMWATKTIIFATRPLSVILLRQKNC